MIKKTFKTPYGEDAKIIIGGWMIEFYLLDRPLGHVHNVYKDDWNEKYKEHMMDKNWFTREMAEWIDEQIKK